MHGLRMRMNNENVRRGRIHGLFAARIVREYSALDRARNYYRMFSKIVIEFVSDAIKTNDRIIHTFRHDREL